MEKPSIHFVGGVPRSGSTLLMNVLAQNPRFHATATSGICEMMMHVRNFWDKISEFRAMPEAENELAKARVLRAMLFSYHRNAERPVVFDKSRGWPAEIELLETLLNRKVKMLVCVRPLLDILSSFEKLYRRSKDLRQVPQEEANFQRFQTLAGRCQVLLENSGMVGQNVNRVKDIAARGLTDRVYFVDFERFTERPVSVMGEIYAFLEETPFNHDFDNVEQVTYEDDRVYVWRDLHKIRSKISPVQSDWKEVLGAGLDQQTVSLCRQNNYFWKGVS